MREKETKGKKETKGERERERARERRNDESHSAVCFPSRKKNNFLRTFLRNAIRDYTDLCCFVRGEDGFALSSHSGQSERNAYCAQSLSCKYRSLLFRKGTKGWLSPHIRVSRGTHFARFVLSKYQMTRERERDRDRDRDRQRQRKRE